MDKQHNNVDPLFREISIRNTSVPSRVLLAPINTGYTIHNRPSCRLLEFHRKRSSPYIGVSMVGNVAVDRELGTNNKTAVLSDKAVVPRFSVLARAIQARGSVPGIQLAGAPRDLFPSRKWRPKDILREKSRLVNIINNLTDKDLKSSLDAFIDSSCYAKSAGFGLVQIHAAHGYLLSLLLCPDINQRKGYYSLGAQWYDNFITQMREAVGEGLLSIRISALVGLRSQEDEINWTKNLIERSEYAGVDIVDLSAGLYTINRSLIYPNRKWDGPVYGDWVADIATNCRCFIVIAGRVTDLREIGWVPENVLVSLGRPFIADPRFAEKSYFGQYDSINKCGLKSHCHYFSRGISSLECGVNEDL